MAIRFLEDQSIDGTLSTTGVITAPGGNSTQWNTGYANSITGFSDSGSSTITLTLTQQDGGTLTTSFSNPQGTVTSVGLSTGTGLDGGGTITTSGSFSITLDLSELTDMTAAMIGTDEFIVLDSGAERRKAANEIGLSIFNNDAGFTTNVGDITAVNAGTNLTGGGTSGSVTLNMATGGIGAGSYGSTANSVKIDNITVDAYGRITAISTGGTGDIDDVTAGLGLSRTGTNVTPIINVDYLGSDNIILDAPTEATGTLSTSDRLMLSSNSTGNVFKSVISNLPFTNNAGDITNVSTTSPITGGGSSGSVTIAHANSGVTAGSYARATVTVNATGHVTSISANGDAQGVTSVATGNGISGGTITSTGTLTVGAGDGLSQSSTGLLVDSTVVRTSGTQSIGGAKTFSDNVTISGDTKNLIIANTAETQSGIVFTDTQAGTSQRAAIKFDSSSETLDFFVNDEANERLSIDTAGTLLINGGALVLGGTGRIRGVDTVSSGTDAANKTYVDNAVAGVPQGDITAVVAGNKLTGGGTSGSVTLGLASNNISQFVNNSGYTTNTGTTTASNTQTFTNKSGNISQWTNNSGYITSASLPTVNNATITIAAGTNLTTGGNFTTNQGINETITINMATGGIGAGSYGSSSDSTKIDSIIVDAYGRVTGVSTGATGQVNQVNSGNLSTMSISSGTTTTVTPITGTVNLSSGNLATGAQIQSAINTALTGVLQFEGTWNASTNTPTLASNVGTSGDYYIVAVAGSTNLNGITDWQIGDWAVFANTTWTKVDNTAVGSMSSWTLKEGNGTETSTVTNGETVTFAQGAGIQTELTSTSSGGTLTISNTITNNTQLTNGRGFTTNTGTTTPSNTQTFTNKSGNISQWNNNSGYITSASLPTVNNPTITITTGTGLDGATSFTLNQSSAKTIALTLDLSEFTDMTAGMNTNDEFIVLDSSAERRKRAGEIGLSIFSNDAGFTSNVGDITGVTAGTGMSGGGTSGTVTLNCTITNNNQLTNGRGFTTNTGTTTASNSQTFTNKSGNISQWSNNSGYITSGSSISGNAATATKFSTGRTNYKGVTDTSVIGQMMWKHYGNNHTIFDASNGTSPQGTSVSNTNPSVPWTGTYPTLMGWNGSLTYGVRVDLSRNTEQLKTARTIAGVSFNGTANISLNNNAITNGAGYTTNVGDITSVSAGTNLTGGGSSGAVTLNMATGGIGSGTYGSSSNSTKIDTISVDAYGRVTAVSTGGTGDIDGITAGSGLTGGGSSGTPTVSVDYLGSDNIILQSPTEATGTLSGSDRLMVSSASTGNVYKSVISNLPFSNNSGDITSVAAGTNMSGGGTSGAVTLNCTLSNNTQLTNGRGFTTNTGTTTASNSQTFTNKGGNISQWTNNSGYTTNAGDITAVTAGTGMSGGGTSGSVTLNCTITNNNQLTNGRGFTTNVGDITAVNAGSGLTGGGSSGSVTLNVDYTGGDSIVMAAPNGSSPDGDDYYMYGADSSGGGDSKKGQFVDLPLSIMDNDAGFKTSSGVTSIATSSPVLGGTITSTGTISLLKPVSGSWHNGGVAIVGAVTEIGRYIDFHKDNSGTSDFDVRLDANGSELNVSTNIRSQGNLEAVGNIVAGRGRYTSGSASQPSISFTSDTNTGMFRGGSDNMQFATGGTSRITVSNFATIINQDCGIGVTPQAKFHVNGTSLVKTSSGVGDFYLGNNATANHFRFHTNNIDTYFDMNCGNVFWRDGGSIRYRFFPSTANMTINGTLTQNSDIRIKENVVEIDDCISKVQAMRGVYYNRTDFNTEVTKVGVIAQEVEAVLPELILENEDDGLKSVAYSELTAVLINAVKEQQAMIEDLKSRIDQLEK